jgi:hypothetical protein
VIQDIVVQTKLQTLFEYSRKMSLKPVLDRLSALEPVKP